MTRNPRGRENDASDSELTRRSYLKFAGTAASGLAAIGVGGTAGAQDGRQTVNVVSAGADKTGETPIDDVLHSAVAENTRILFPPGTYRLNGFSADGLSNVSFVGKKATLVPPEGSTGNLLSLSGTNVTVEGFTFDYSAPSTAPMVTMVCTDGLVLKDCDFVGVADVSGGGGNSGHQYHFLPAITSPEGSGLVKNVSLADGAMSPSNRGGIWFGQNNLGTLTFDGLHMEKWANNSLYCYNSGGPVIVKNSYFRNNNVGGPRIGSNGTRVLDTTIVSDGEVPVQAFTGGQNSRGIWIPKACEDVLIEGCDFVMSGPYASAGIVYDAPGANADVKNCRFEMDVDQPAIECPVDGGPITINNVSVTGDGAGEGSINVSGRGQVSDVCIQGTGPGNSCKAASSRPPAPPGQQRKGKKGGKKGRKSRGGKKGGKAKGGNKAGKSRGRKNASNPGKGKAGGK